MKVNKRGIVISRGWKNCQGECMWSALLWTGVERRVNKRGLQYECPAMYFFEKISSRGASFPD